MEAGIIILMSVPIVLLAYACATLAMDIRRMVGGKHERKKK